MSLGESESVGLGWPTWEARSWIPTDHPSPHCPIPTPRYNSAKKDNDFIYHEAIPALDTLQPVKGLKQRGRAASVAVGDEGGAMDRGTLEV